MDSKIQSVKSNARHKPIKRIISSMNGINTWSLKLKTNYKILMNSCNQLSPGDKTELGQDARFYFQIEK